MRAIMIITFKIKINFNRKIHLSGEKVEKYKAKLEKKIKRWTIKSSRL